MHGLGPALFEILELHQQRYIEPVFTLAQVRDEAWNERPWRADVAARRRDASRAGEIGNVGRAMVKFKTESHELAGHVIECARSVPCLELVAGVQREVRSAGESRRAIDGRKKDKITSRISNCTAQCDSVQVFVEPNAVVKHGAKEGLLRSLPGITKATYAAAAFAARIQRERERCFVRESRWIVIIFDLDTVIAVISRPMRRSQCVLAQKI